MAGSVRVRSVVPSPHQAFAPMCSTEDASFRENVGGSMSSCYQSHHNDEISPKLLECVHRHQSTPPRAREGIFYVNSGLRPLSFGQGNFWKTASQGQNV